MFGSEGATYISDALLIYKLGNNIDSQGAISLSKALRINNTLTTIWLKGSLMQLFIYYWHFVYLYYSYISGNNIDDVGAQALLDMLT